MELQTRAISYLRFNAPQYQYKPSQEAKIHNKKYLQMYYKSNPDNSFVQIVETIFSDRYLYEHVKFRSLVEENKKGFVHIDTIFQQQLVEKFLKEMGDKKPKHKDVIQLIKKLSTKLICNRNQVRRKFPFVNKLQLSKPVYLEEYPQNDGNEELETLLQSTTNIYKINYHHNENWATVFSEDPDKIKKLNGHFWSIKTYFRVKSYEKAKQIFENGFVASGYELKKFYQKSIFNKNRQQEERYNRYHDEDSDGDFDNDNRRHQMESSDNEMDDEEEYRSQLHYLRNRRGDRNPLSRQKKLTQKEKERKQYLQPNFNFNVALLANNNQSKIPQFSKQSILNQEREKQIQDILLQFYEESTLSLPCKTKIKQSHMQLQ